MAKIFNGQAIQLHIAKSGEEAYNYFVEQQIIDPAVSTIENIQALIMYCADLNKEIADNSQKERGEHLDKFNSTIASQANIEDGSIISPKVKKATYADLITKKISFERRNKSEKAKRLLKENSAIDQFNSNVVRAFTNDCIDNNQDSFVHFDISTGLPVDSKDNEGNIADETLNEVFSESVIARKRVISLYQLFYQAAAAAEYITDGEIGFNELKHLADCYYTRNNGMRPTRFKIFMKFYKSLQLGLKYEFEETESMLKELGLGTLANPGALKKLVKGFNAEFMEDKDIFMWGEDPLIVQRLEDIAKREEEHRKLLSEKRYERKKAKEAAKAAEVSK